MAAFRLVVKGLRQTGQFFMICLAISIPLILESVRAGAVFAHRFSLLELYHLVLKSRHEIPIAPDLCNARVLTD